MPLKEKFGKRVSYDEIERRLYSHDLANLPGIVDRLVRRGLLLRSEDPQERRRLVLTLTPKGSRHLEQARSATRTWIAEVLAPLPRPALRRIEEGISLLGSVFSQAIGSNGGK